MMTSYHYDDDTGYSATTYMRRKGIGELFEALMTGLMVHKPEDHIGFIRQCLDKVEDNPKSIHWDAFVKSMNHWQSIELTKSSAFLLERSRISSTSPFNRLLLSSSSSKQQTLNDVSTDDPTHRCQDLPIVLILSSAGSLKLCARLLERYQKINYLSINNIEDDESFTNEDENHRYDQIQRAIEEHNHQATGFLLAGDFREHYYLEQWLAKIGRLDAIFVLSPNPIEIKLVNDLRIIQIDVNDDFENILARTINTLDQIFPYDIFSAEHSSFTSRGVPQLSLPILFCMDTHWREDSIDQTLIDEEFQINDENDQMEYSNNSFMSTLCTRLAEQFSLKYIYYGNQKNALMTLEQLKMEIIQSMSTLSGYIIGHFPNTLNDLQKFEDEIGPCSALIYIGDCSIDRPKQQFTDIIEKFKRENKAIHIDCQVEVDDIYEDLKKDISILIEKK